MVDWVTTTEYAKMTGKSTNEVRKLIKEKLLEAVPSEGGGKFLVKVERNEEVRELIGIVLKLTERVDKLSKHLGVS